MTFFSNLTSRSQSKFYKAKQTDIITILKKYKLLKGVRHYSCKKNDKLGKIFALYVMVKRLAPIIIY